MTAKKRLPVVDADLCDGCGVCVEACGPACLEVAKGLATLPRPDACGSEAHCVSPCPTEAIRMAWVPFDGDRTRGAWREAESG